VKITTSELLPPIPSSILNDTHADRQAEFEKNITIWFCIAERFAEEVVLIGKKVTTALGGARGGSRQGWSQKKGFEKGLGEK
jgi:hypothetical protein